MKFSLNGAAVDVEAPPLKRVLDVLREEMGLTGTKEGCGEGECGTCTVLLNGVPVNACLIPFVQLRDAELTTIEGLAPEDALARCFLEENAAQCGICTPGMLLAASVLPTGCSEDDVRRGLAGNLCRCTGYTAIYRAVRKCKA